MFVCPDFVATCLVYLVWVCKSGGKKLRSGIIVLDRPVRLRQSTLIYSQSNPVCGRGSDALSWARETTGVIDGA
jgi:hypothetical protein